MLEPREQQMSVKAEVTGHIQIPDAPPGLVDQFIDRLMEALENDGAVHDPRMSGSLASGELSVHFMVYGRSKRDIDDMGPKHLHDAVKCARATQAGDGTNIPNNTAEGQFDEVQDLTSRPAMVRAVTCELADA